ncbi:MAG: DUF3014 domain-containing protein [Steroidobacteraceae bacterium]|jgi:hypothetical protein|nr:DUF3014 domain-containing protein [Steroidobacteraceae bacterium]
MIQADPDEPRPGIHRETPTDEALGGKVLIGVVVLVALVGAAWWWSSREAPVPVVDEPAVAPAVVAQEPVPVRHPVDAPAAEELAEPLPLLDDSTLRASEEIVALVGVSAFGELFLAQEVVRRFVAAVDNLPRRELPVAQRPLRGAAGVFLAAGEEGALVVDEANYARYEPYARLATLLDARAAVAAYQRLYPLAQQAYEELGYPGRYFNDRLIEAIDDLLAAPEIEGPIPLKRPNVVYEFADASLEARSAGQKILIRMGPSNARAVKAKLIEIRALLAKG